MPDHDNNPFIPSHRHYKSLDRKSLRFACVTNLCGFIKAENSQTLWQQQRENERLPMCWESFFPIAPFRTHFSDRYMCKQMKHKHWTEMKWIRIIVKGCNSIWIFLTGGLPDWFVNCVRGNWSFLLAFASQPTPLSHNVMIQLFALLFPTPLYEFC